MFVDPRGNFTPTLLYRLTKGYILYFSSNSLKIYYHVAKLSYHPLRNIIYNIHNSMEINFLNDTIPKNWEK